MPKPERITPKKQRRLVENAIERLVELLDQMDGDQDDEPSLGWPAKYEEWPQDPSDGYDTGDDREGYGASGQYSRLHEGDDEPIEDNEPALGWTNAVNQTRNHPGGGWGHEAEASLGWQNEGSQALLTAGTNDEREKEHDNEASLGWQNWGSQAFLDLGTNDDREEQCEDEGSNPGI